MTGITNANTGAVRLFATIQVTYPEGSTLTCTDGQKTFTAKTNIGVYIFAIPYAATWTVTITDGTETASEDVVISTEGQSVRVSLTYLVPDEYQAVEYLQGTNGPYIRTGYTITNLTDVEIELNNSTENSDGSCIFGSRPGYPSPSWVIFTSSTGSVGLNINADYGSIGTFNVGRQNISNDGTKFYVNGTLAKTISASSYSISAEACFFAMYDRGTWGAFASSARLYWAKIRENGEVVKHYVPCYRKSDHVVGLWERINGEFLVSATSGTFIAGGAI